MLDTRNTIIRLLQNIGSRKEVEQYLKQFASMESKQFAVIKVGGGVLRDDLEALASSLSFLHKVGLFPIVVLGGGPQLNEALEEAGIETPRIDGMRVTTPDALEVARKVFQNVNLQLVDALEALGTHARPITSGVFEAELLDHDRLGLVGEVRGIHTEGIVSAIRSGCLPILSSLGETPTGQIVNINADVAARELALRIQPFKIVFLTPTGGLLDQYERLIPSVNLTEDYDELMQQDWVHSGMRLKLQQIKELLDQLPLSSSVSITTPGQLARELFTHRGSGTLVRRGESVQCHPSMEKLDRTRIRELLEACFQRQLADDYFELKPFHRIYLTDSYRATAILTLEDGLPYLDKFGVTRKAQGEGLGQSLWARMKRENSKLFWRARSENPINNWYFQESDGTYSAGRWTVFWYGMESFEEMKRCVEIALAMPATFYEHAVADA
ncbi:acetylglutamate kinase [Lujinxingia litoralis]|uniref:Acetylglutamate kinase n=1 Tax=Lujinxingia litoralis TaxID=2211119 RepID=A0A328CBL6_9DELT|nr:acetylglutamate kinase [Lujinxingia litoralis]RAL22887.1 acetylglutamate kinase [Lujinxingia litoralis]